jgi:hypothetical protein
MPAPLSKSVRNKANSVEATGRASTWWKKTYGELNMQETSAKQSQFPHGQHWARAGNAVGAAHRAGCTNKANLPRTDRKRRWAGAGNAADGDKRAKRSQFAPRADARDLESVTVCGPPRGNYPDKGSFALLWNRGIIAVRAACPCVRRHSLRPSAEFERDHADPFGR